MIVSTKGRYALRVMIDLAEHDDGEYVVLMDIAKREELSEKYPNLDFQNEKALCHTRLNNLQK